jgi:hypothetical protein
LLLESTSTMPTRCVVHVVALLAGRRGCCTVQVCCLLQCLFRLLASKNVYKQLQKAPLEPLGLILQASLRKEDESTAMWACKVSEMVVVRVGFPELKASSKEANQAKREAVAKDRFVAAGGLDAVFEALPYCHAASTPALADALCRLLLGLTFARAETAPVGCLETALSRLGEHQGLLWEWSRSPSPRLRVSAMGVLRGMLLSSTPAETKTLQDNALKWGALLWHLRLSVAATREDGAFSKYAQCVAALARVRAAELAESTQQHRGPFNHRAKDLIEEAVAAEEDGLLAGGLDAVSKDVRVAAEGACTHSAAREASREIVAILCACNSDAQAVVRRAFPSGLLRTLVNAPPVDAVDAVSTNPSEDLPDDEVLVGVGEPGFLWWDNSQPTPPADKAAVSRAASSCLHQWYLPTCAPVPAEYRSKRSKGRARSALDEAEHPAPTAADEVRSGQQVWACQSVTSPDGWHWTRFWEAFSRHWQHPLLVWRPASLDELRSGLWEAEAGLDQMRRRWKRLCKENRSVRKPGGAAAAIAGAGTIADERRTAAGRAWYGAEARADDPAWVADVLTPEPAILWEFTGFMVHYPSLDRLLNVDGVFVHSLLPLLPRLAAGEGGVPLPRSIVPSMVQAIACQHNPMRRLALLRCLRGVVQCVVLDPDPDADTDPTSLARVGGLRTQSTGLSPDELLRQERAQQEAADRVAEAAARMSAGGDSEPPSSPSSKTAFSPSSPIALLELRQRYLSELRDRANRPTAGSRALGLGKEAVDHALAIELLVPVLLQLNAGIADVAVGAPIPGEDGAFHRVRGPNGAPLHLLPPGLGGVPSRQSAVTGKAADPFSKTEPTKLGGRSLSSTEGDPDSMDPVDADDPPTTAVEMVSRRRRSTAPPPRQEGFFSAVERPWAVAGIPLKWQKAWRSEILLLFRTLATLPRCASALATNAGQALDGLLPMLIVPPGSNPEPLKPHAGEDVPGIGTGVVKASGARDDEDDADDVLTGNRRAVVSAPLITAFEAGDTDDDEMSDGYECGLFELPEDPTPDTSALAASPGRKWWIRQRKLPQRSVWSLHFHRDPDTRLFVSQKRPGRAILARVAAEALELGTRASPQLAQFFAREDRMSALVLPLLQAASHPRLVASVLRVMREVLCRVPMYHSALHRHALFQALLLTSDVLGRARRRGRAAAGRAAKTRQALGKRQKRTDTKQSAQAEKDAREEPAPTGEPKPMRVGEGLCLDAAILLAELHLSGGDAARFERLDRKHIPTGRRYEADPSRQQGQLHSHLAMLSAESAGSRVEEDLGGVGGALTAVAIHDDDDEDSVLPAASASASSVGVRSARRATTTLDDHLSDSSSALRLLLPPSMVSLLRKRGAAAFAAVFNAEDHASADALWTREMRHTLLRQLRRQLAPLIAWVNGHPLARRILHPQAKHSPFAPSAFVSKPPPVHSFKAVQSSAHPPVPAFSGGCTLAYPPTEFVPDPRQVRYPQLDDEPRVGGVYLRVYVGGTRAPTAPGRFIRLLVARLHEEVAALAAAHLMLTEGTLSAAASAAGVKVEGSDAIARVSSGGMHDALDDVAASMVPRKAWDVDASLLPASSSAASASAAAPGSPSRRLARAAIDSLRKWETEQEAALIGVSRLEAGMDPGKVFLESEDLSSDEDQDATGQEEQEESKTAPSKRVLTPTQLYRRHHLRCQITLQAIQRFLADSPGTKLPTDTFGALAVLASLPQGRYPVLAAQGLAAEGGLSVRLSGEVDLTTPLQDRVSADVRAEQSSIAFAEAPGVVDPMAEEVTSGVRVSLDSTYVIENLPPTPSPLLLLLPPAEAHDADDDPMRDELFGLTKDDGRRVRGFRVSSQPKDPFSKTSASLSTADSAVYHPLRFQRQAERVRDVVCQRGASSRCLVSLALEVIRDAIVPPGQTAPIPSTVTQACQGGALGAALSLIAWCVPLLPSGAAEVLAACGQLESKVPTRDTADAGVVLRSAIAPSAMSPAERTRLWLIEPVLGLALHVIATAARTDEGASLFVARPQLIPAVLRCVRVPWDAFESVSRRARGAAAAASASTADDDSSGPVNGIVLAGGVGGSGQWVASEFMAAQACMRLAKPALECVQALASVFPCRRALVDSGAVVFLLQTMLGGPDAAGNFPVAGKSIEGDDGKELARWRKRAADARATEGNEDAEEDGAEDDEFDDGGVSQDRRMGLERVWKREVEAAEDGDASSEQDGWSEWDIRRATELVLFGLLRLPEPERTLSRRVSDSTAITAPTTSDPVLPPTPTLSQADLEDAEPEAPPYLTKQEQLDNAAQIQKRVDSVLARFRARALAASTAGVTSLLRTAASEEDCAATELCTQVCRSFMTPGMLNLLVHGSSVSGERVGSPDGSCLRVSLRGSLTEKPRVIWIPTMREQLLRRLSHEAVFIDSRVRETGLLDKLGIGSAAAWGVQRGKKPRSLKGVAKSVVSISRMGRAAAAAASASEDDPGAAAADPSATVVPRVTTGKATVFYGDMSTLDSTASASSSWGGGATDTGLPGNPFAVGPAGVGVGAAPPHATARGQHAMLWSAERYSGSDVYRELYPSLANELVIEGVYVRLYFLQPDMSKARPEPEALARAIMREVGAIHERTRVFDPLSPRDLHALLTMLRAGGALLARIPRLRFTCAASEHLAALVSMVRRDLTAHARTLRLGADPIVEVGGMEAGLWTRVLHAALTMIVHVANTPAGAKALSTELHGLHCLLRREELLGDDGTWAEAEPATAKAPPQSAKTIPKPSSEPTDDVALDQGPSLEASQKQTTSLLAVRCLAGMLRHAPAVRGAFLDQGAALSVLSIVTNTLQEQSDEKRLHSVRCLVAAMGGAPPSVSPEEAPSAPADDEDVTMHDASTAADDVSGAVEASGFGKGAVEERLVRWFKAVVWPLFDNQVRKARVLERGWKVPQGVLGAWEQSLREPHIVWGEDTRKDVRSFIENEWTTADDWLTSRPEDPLSYRLDNLFDRLHRKALSREAVVGDVFLFPFNSKPNVRELDPAAFLKALLERAKKELPTAMNPGMTRDEARIVAGVWTAVFHVLETHAALRSDPALIAAVPLALSFVAPTVPLRIQRMSLAVLTQAGENLEALERAGTMLASRSAAYFQSTRIARSASRGSSAASASASASGESEETEAADILDGGYDGLGGEHSPEFVGWTLLADMARRSTALVFKFYASGLLLYAVHCITLATLGEDALNEAAVAACRFIASMVLDKTNGLAVKEVVCDMVTTQLSSEAVFERKPDGIFRFLSRDHSDKSSGREWNAAARDALTRFLAEEISSFEAGVKAEGLDRWEGRSVRWDSKRLRRLHPKPIDTSVLLEGAGGSLA